MTVPPMPPVPKPAAPPVPAPPVPAPPVPAPPVPVRAMLLHKATVTAVGATAGTVDVTLADGVTTHAGVFHLGPPPAVGDAVMAAQAGTTLLVLGVLPSPVRVVSGTATLNLTSGQTETNTNISFGTTLSTSTPAVVVTYWDSGGGQNSYILKITARSATQFTATVRKPDNTAFGASITIGCMWIARG